MTDLRPREVKMEGRDDGGIRPGVNRRTRSVMVIAERPV